jgi:hypothetical protein
MIEKNTRIAAADGRDDNLIVKKNGSEAAEIENLDFTDLAEAVVLKQVGQWVLLDVDGGLAVIRSNLCLSYREAMEIADLVDVLAYQGRL